MLVQVYLKGKAKRHSDEATGEQHGIRHKKPKQSPDFVMQGNSNVSYGKFIHQVRSASQSDCACLLQQYTPDVGNITAFSAYHLPAT